MIGVGQQLGGYTILKRIGHGWLGDVYLAQHRRVARRAAVKVLLPELAQKATVLDQFFKEARNTTLIKHPGIVEILDCDLVDDQAFIIMEFLDGESLGGYLARNGTLEQDLAFLLGVVAAAAGAIGAAHVAGIVHRDLKPENVYLHLATPMDPSVTVKVLDFGIAKLSREDGGPSKTASGMLLGSPTYMSPEQCRGVGMPDARSDIYSLGCILYEALCGRSPFPGLGMGDLMVAHISQLPKPPVAFVRGLSPKLNSLVMRMLAKKPEERPQTMTEVIVKLRDCARALGIDFEGHLQPLNPVERPMDMVALVPGTAPIGPAAEGARPIEARSDIPSARTNAPSLRVILPPAPPMPATSARLPLPAAPLPIRALVGGTLILEVPAEAEPLEVSRHADRAPRIQAVPGGTMILEASDAPHRHEEPPEESDEPDEPDEPDEESRTASLSAPTWRDRLAHSANQRNGRLAIAGGLLILFAAGTAIFVSTGDEPRTRASDGRDESQIPPMPAEPTPSPAEPSLVPTTAQVDTRRVARSTTVQIDIEGLDPRTAVTVDGQAATLPLRLPRGPQVHRIVLRPPTGRQRSVEIDGTRDRVIELLTDRGATITVPTTTATRRERAPKAEIAPAPPATSSGSIGTATKKPTPANEFKAITDL